MKKDEKPRNGSRKPGPVPKPLEERPVPFLVRLEPHQHRWLMGKGGKGGVADYLRDMVQREMDRDKLITDLIPSSERMQIEAES